MKEALKVGSINFLNKEGNCRNILHFMDKPDPGREAPDELTRESLIAISYSEPEKVLSSKLSSEKINGENVTEEADCDREDKYRSELISISYQQSPEVENRPLEELNVSQEPC